MDGILPILPLDLVYPTFKWLASSWRLFVHARKNILIILPPFFKQCKTFRSRGKIGKIFLIPGEELSVPSEVTEGFATPFLDPGYEELYDFTQRLAG
jgi:hypothetical protein